MNWKVLLWLGIGIFAAIALNNTIAGFANPVLSPLKLSVSLNG